MRTPLPDCTLLFSNRSKIKRFHDREILQLFAVAIACLSIVSETSYAANTKPNVLILVSDDQGWGDVGYHNAEMSTPNIDQLAKDGLEMNRWYSYPICSPTRTSLLTGHIAMRHGFFWAMPGSMVMTSIRPSFVFQR